MYNFPLSKPLPSHKKQWNPFSFLYFYSFHIKLLRSKHRFSLSWNPILKASIFTDRLLTIKPVVSIGILIWMWSRSNSNAVKSTIHVFPVTKKKLITNRKYGQRQSLIPKRSFAECVALNSPSVNTKIAAIHVRNVQRLLIRDAASIITYILKLGINDQCSNSTFKFIDQE